AAAEPQGEARLWSDALVRQCRAMRDDLEFLAGEMAGAREIPTLRALAAEGNARAAGRMTQIELLASWCDELARMKYDFLYDRARHLLAIGYNVSERRLDPGYYDL